MRDLIYVAYAKYYCVIHIIIVSFTLAVVFVLLGSVATELR